MAEIKINLPTYSGPTPKVGSSTAGQFNPPKINIPIRRGLGAFGNWLGGKLKTPIPQQGTPLQPLPQPLPLSQGFNQIVSGFRGQQYTPVAQPQQPQQLSNITVPSNLAGPGIPGTNVQRTGQPINVQPVQPSQTVTQPTLTAPSLSTSFSVPVESGKMTEPTINGNAVEVTPTTSTSTETLQNGVSNLDIQSLLKKNLDKQDEFLQNIQSYFTPSEQEKFIQEQINQATKEYNDQNIALGTQGILGSVASAQQARAYELAQNKLNSLTNTLSNVQATRKDKLEAAKFLFDANKNSFTSLLDTYTKLAPQNIGSKINDATGDVYVIFKDPLTGKASTQLVGNVGVGAKQLDFGKIGTDMFGNDQYGFINKTTGEIAPIQSGTTPQASGATTIGNVATGLNTPAAKNNNPGNLKNPDGSWQSFATPQEGFQALVNDVTAKQTGNTRTGLNANSTLLQFFQKYAPASDNNNPVAYAQSVAQQLGTSVNTPIGQLDSTQLASAIAQHEDGAYWKAITEQTAPQASAQDVLAAAMRIKYNGNEDRKFSLGTVQSLLQNGDLEGARQFVETKAIANAPATTKEKLETLQTVKDLADRITQYVGDSGLGGTGPLGLGTVKGFLYNVGIGSNESEIVRQLIGNIRGTMQKARAGTALTPTEVAQLDQYVPSKNERGEKILNKLNQLKLYADLTYSNTLKILTGGIGITSNQQNQATPQDLAYIQSLGIK